MVIVGFPLRGTVTQHHLLLCNTKPHVDFVRRVCDHECNAVAGNTGNPARMHDPGVVVQGPSSRLAAHTIAQARSGNLINQRSSCRSPLDLDIHPSHLYFRCFLQRTVADNLNRVSVLLKKRYWAFAAE